MTTMELNLRKENLIGYIKSMDEATVCKVEQYIKRLCQASFEKEEEKEVKPYPSLLSGEELHSVVAESENNYRNGHFIEENDMDLYIRSLK